MESADPLRIIGETDGVDAEAMSEKTEHDHGDVALREARPRLRRPPLYKVVLVNDDYTPMDFVVQVLERFFAKNREDATRIMLEVHTAGRGICGVFTHEIAETKTAQVNDFAREHRHPLLCTLEQA